MHRTAILIPFFLASCLVAPGTLQTPTVFVKHVGVISGANFLALQADGLADAVAEPTFKIHAAVDDWGRQVDLQPYSGLINASVGAMGKSVGYITRPPHSFEVKSPRGLRRIDWLNGTVEYEAVASSIDVVVENPVKGRRFKLGRFTLEVDYEGLDLRVDPKDSEDPALEIHGRILAAHALLKDGSEVRAKEWTILGGHLVLWVFEGKTIRQDSLDGTGLRFFFESRPEEGTIAALRFRFADRTEMRTIPFRVTGITF